MLQDARLIRTEIRGRHRWHHLTPEPLALVQRWAPHGDGPGVDAGLLAARDGQPRTVPVIRLNDLGEAMASVRQHGGQVVVEPSGVPGVGSGCHILDPAGVLIGLHHYDPDA